MKNKGEAPPSSSSSLPQTRSASSGMGGDAYGESSSLNEGQASMSDSVKKAFGVGSEKISQLGATAREAMKRTAEASSSSLAREESSAQTRTANSTRSTDFGNSSSGDYGQSSTSNQGGNDMGMGSCFLGGSRCHGASNNKKTRITRNERRARVFATKILFFLIIGRNSNWMIPQNRCY
jgi:hypothetical protein